MEDQGIPAVSVSEFVELLNQTFEFAFPTIIVTGEMANFKVSRGKWVFFDLKDDTASVRCFGTVQHLPGPLEDGMLLNVRAMPRLHAVYGFSLSVQTIQPAGEGAIRRAAELLAAKLKTEGLFDDARKRSIPHPPERIGLVTSAGSAAFADFMKILGARWGGIEVSLIDVQVQGDLAPQQIVVAIERFNQTADPPEVLVLIRGGGSADDLAAFSTESVTRAVAASRIPVLAAIGHEIDTSLVELAADRRASTPSNAAELLVPDKRTALEAVAASSEQLYDAVQDYLHEERQACREAAGAMHGSIEHLLGHLRTEVAASRQVLEVLNPQAALKRGYAVIRQESGIVRSAGDLQKGGIVHIELADGSADATIEAVRKR